MNIEFEDFEPSVGVEAIKLFQSFFGFKFPKQYENFLLKHNGGATKKDIFKFYDLEDISSIRFF